VLNRSDCICTVLIMELLTIAQLLGHANSTQILPTYVKPLDENTRAVIEALDAARTSRPRTSGSIH
jgi:hypothetical protein